MLLTSATKTLLLFSTLLPQLAHSYELVFYSGSGCRGQRLGKVLTGQTRDECKRDHSGNAGSVMVKSTGKVDDEYMVVLFDSDDCNPKGEVIHGDESDGCLDKSYSGYQVVDTSKVK